MEPVVMVVVVAAGDAIVVVAVRAHVPGPCLTISGATGSATRSSGLLSTDWLCTWGHLQHLLTAEHCVLESVVLSPIRASVQLAPYGRG